MVSMSQSFLPKTISICTHRVITAGKKTDGIGQIFVNAAENSTFWKLSKLMEDSSFLGYKKGLEVLMKSEAVTMYAEQAGFEHHIGKKILERVIQWFAK